MTVIDVLRSLWADPIGLLIGRWNWKSAFLSSLFRGLIFFCTNLTAGLHAATGALMAEFCYRGLTAGFYGTLTQSLSDAEPPWAATLAAMILLPLGSHVLEVGVHLLRHTPKLAVSVTSSMCFTVLSTLFHLYAMRRGVLVVRAGASSLAEDMSRMPRLVLAFLAAGPLALLRSPWAVRWSAPQNRNQTFTRL